MFKDKCHHVQTGNKFNVNVCHTHEYVCIRMYTCESYGANSHACVVIKQYCK